MFTQIRAWRQAIKRSLIHRLFLFQAYNCIEDLKSRVPKIVLHYYVQPKALEAIFNAMDMPLPGSAAPNINGFKTGGGGLSGDEDGEEFVEEDVIDDD